MLTLIVGTFDRLENALAERLVRAREAARNRPLREAVVTPSRILNRRLQYALARERGMALAGVRFHTFHSLAQDILRDSGRPSSALVEGRALDEALLDGILRSGKADTTLARLADTPGLISALLGSLYDLEEARVEADELAGLIPQGGERCAGLERLLPLMVGLRTGRRAAGVLGRAEVAGEAAAAAGSSRLVGSLARIHFFGAYDLTQSLVDFVEALAARTDTIAYLPALVTGRGRLHPAYRFAETTRTLLGQKAGSEEWLEGPPAGPLGEWLANVMAERAAPAATALSRVVWTEATDPADEMERIASECRRLADEEGYRPSDIAVVCRLLDGVAGLAAAAFESAGLPVTSTARVPLVSLPLGADLAAFVEVLSGDFGPDPVAAAVTSVWLASGGEPVPLSAAGAFVGRLWAGARPGDWARLKALESDRRLAPHVGPFLSAVARLGRLAEGFPAADSWDGYVSRLSQVVVDVLPAERLAGSPESRAVAECFMAALAGLRWLGRSGPDSVAAGDFWRAARRACREAAVAPWSEPGGVALLDAMSARGIRPRALFLAGLNDGVFPRSVREDPFLRDAAREFLNEVAGNKVQVKGREGADEERLLFHLLLGSPRERLSLSWCANDLQGRPAQPSGFLVETAGVVWPGANPADILAVIGRGGLPAVRGPALPLPSARPLFEAARKVTRELEAAGRAGARDGILHSPAPLPKGLSVTELRDYVACPFRIHGRVTLGIRPPEGPEGPWAPQPFVTGNVVHGILEGVVRELSPRWGELTGKDLEEAIARHLPRVFGKMLPQYEAVPVLATALQEEMREWMTDLLLGDLAWTRQSGFVPRDIEEYVSGAEIECPAGKMLLRGTSDRVDRRGEAARVVDYKTHSGRKEFKSRASFTPEFMQAGLYRHMRGLPVDGLVLSIIHMGPAQKPVAQTVEEGQAREYAEKALEAGKLAASLALAGMAFPLPKEVSRFNEAWEAPCRFCDFDRFCRKDHAPTRGRLAAFPPVAGFSSTARAVYGARGSRSSAPGKKAAPRKGRKK